MQNNFKKFKKIPLIISLFFFLLSFFAWLFIYKNIGDNNQIFDEVEMQLQDEATKKDEIRSLDRLLKAVEPERTLLDSHFIKSSNVVPLLDTIEKLAPQVKVKAEVASVDILSGNASLVVGVKAVGSFQGIYKFLTLLENSPYQLEFLSMNLQQIGGTTLPPKGQVSDWSAVFKIKLLSFTL
jgi:hypothetical protein